MRSIFLLFALISFAFISSCNQEVEDQFVAPVELSATAGNNFEADNFDENNQASDVKANFSLDIDDHNLYENELISVSNKSLNADSYLWDFGNGETSTEATPTFKYDMHGYYTITLTVTDADGNSHQASHGLSVLCLYGGGDHDQ